MKERNLTLKAVFTVVNCVEATSSYCYCLESRKPCCQVSRSKHPAEPCSST